MGKVETTIRSEIIRLAKRETRRITVPLSRNLRSVKSTVIHLRRILSALEKSVTSWERDRASQQGSLAASAEEVKGARFSPRLIRALRKRLRVTQGELAALVGVTVGAIYQWEKGIFVPRNDKKGALIALRKLGRREVKRLLGEKRGPERRAEKGTRTRRPRRKTRRRTSKK